MSITYQLLSAEAIPEVSELVARVFNEFVAPEYSTEGVQEFYRYIQPSAFRARSETKHFSVVALAKHKVVGMIEMRGPDLVSLLFVAPEFQRRGIAQELLHQAL